MSAHPCIVQVAVPSPLHRSFDYLFSGPAPAPGSRVRVPFGRTEPVGVVVGLSDESSVGRHKLKPVTELLDEHPVLPAEVLEFARWAARYYHHPLGEVLNTLLPPLLRQGAPAVPPNASRWRLTDPGRAANATELARRAPRQAAVLARLQAAGEPLGAEAFAEQPGDWRGALAALGARGWLETVETPDYGLIISSRTPASAPPLNAHQATASEAILGGLSRYGCFLLDGVTGSGKTEVYLAAIDAVVAAGRQALVLVPEIGLTPQLIERFSRRFQQPMAVFHSALSDRERLNAWLAARDGRASIIIGTRSAIFTPLARPGLLILDEEHDLSFKQQDGFRYGGRDLAAVRAQRLDIPLVLGSATPSLETLHNAQRGRYTHLRLPERAGVAQMPSFRLLDIRGQNLQGGLSNALLGEVRRHLEQDGQVLLFLNRRGYAPTLLCHGCGWVCECPRCDARLTLHQRVYKARCHHCGHERSIPSRCPDCGSDELQAVGQGTERVENVLRQCFPDHGLVRIDRDSTRRKGAMAELLEQARSGEGRILLGTQMLAKGHHLPAVTLVGIIDADSGLFGADFRAPERLAQLVIQVAGRAGREERRGEVIIQTHHPEHPLLQTLLRDGYGRFAEEALAERRLIGLPPFCAMALLRAEAVQLEAPLQFLQQAKALAQSFGIAGITLLGPAPAPMERRAGRFRAQLLLQAPQRGSLQQLLDRWVEALSGLAGARKVRWSVDVDPMEML